MILNRIQCLPNIFIGKKVDMNQDKHVIGVFKNTAAANTAILSLQETGIPSKDLSLLVNDSGKGHHFSVDSDKSKTAEGVGYGAVLGGLAAGLGVVAAGVASVTIPGAVFVAGPLGVSLAAGAAGAATGGLAGGLIGLGIPEDEVTLVENDINDGNILVAAHGLTSEQKSNAITAMKSSGALRVH